MSKIKSGEIKDEKLLPCPFCGNERILDFAEESNGVTWFWFACSECLCDTAKRTSEEKAIQDWNTRTESARIEELEKEMLKTSWRKIESESDLPEAGRLVEVTAFNAKGENRGIAKGRYLADKNRWKLIGTGLLPNYCSVLAWRELPEPYGEDL